MKLLILLLFTGVVMAGDRVIEFPADTMTYEKGWYKCRPCKYGPEFMPEIIGFSQAFYDLSCNAQKDSITRILPTPQWITLNQIANHLQYLSNWIRKTRMNSEEKETRILGELLYLRLCIEGRDILVTPKN